MAGEDSPCLNRAYAKSAQSLDTFLRTKEWVSSPMFFRQVEVIRVWWKNWPKFAAWSEIARFSYEYSVSLKTIVLSIIVGHLFRACDARWLFITPKKVRHERSLCVHFMVNSRIFSCKGSRNDWRMFEKVKNRLKTIHILWGMLFPIPWGYAWENYAGLSEWIFLPLRANQECHCGYSIRIFPHKRDQGFASENLFVSVLIFWYAKRREILSGTQNARGEILHGFRRGMSQPFLSTKTMGNE